MKLLTTILSFSLLSAVLPLVSLAQAAPPDAAKEYEAITIVRSGSKTWKCATPANGVGAG